jgi:heme-degrading monooxygenase HmoA
MGRRHRGRVVIARRWSCRAQPENVDGYVNHFQESVLPALRRIDGHRGAYVLKRPRGDEIEILVLTLWESMDAIRAFAGAEPSLAVVEDEAKAFLSRFDPTVEHYEVVLDFRKK